MEQRTRKTQKEKVVSVMSWAVKLDGVPVPKSRPRFTRTGHAYTDPKTRDYEKTVGAAWVKQWGANMRLEGDLHATVIVGTPNMRGDVDNFAKSVLDALQLVGAFDRGDEQVTSLRVFKVRTSREEAYTFAQLMPAEAFTVI
jgi:Holliday junction resolvase RusA-like endonuclease